MKKSTLKVLGERREFSIVEEKGEHNERFHV